MHKISRPLIVLAWINVVLHIIALVLADEFIRQGSPLVSFESRVDYLRSAPIGWTIAWVTWMLCAVALVTFLAMLATRYRRMTSLAQLGLTIAVVGAAFDLFCDCVYIFVFPRVAELAGADDLFLIIERITGIASMVIANGAYSIAILMLNEGLRGRWGLARLAFFLGYGVAGCGFLLAAAGFTGVPWHAEWATPPTIGLFCVWAVLVAHSTTPFSRDATYSERSALRSEYVASRLNGDPGQRRP